MERKGIGAFLRVIRERRGMSVERLSKRIGVSSLRLRQIEAGRADLRLDEWLGVCRCLGLNLWGEEDAGYWRGLDAAIKRRRRS